MAEEVEIGNVGGEGVASEITLKRLLASNEKMAKALGVNPGSQEKRLRDLHNKSIKEGTTATTAGTKATKGFTSALGSASSALLGAAGLIGNAFTAAVGSAIGSAVGLSKELLMGGNQIGDFARHLPILGNQLGAIGYFIDGQVDMYRNLSGVGANFNNSIIEMNRAAINAEMGLGSFAEIVSNNSQAMGFFGTNVAGGANAFGELSKRLRTGEIGVRLQTMGFNLQDINEGLISYTTQQARLGRLEGMSTSQLIAGSQNYLEEIDKLARATGINRKQQEQVALRNAAEANVMVMQNRLSGEALTNFRGNLQQAAELGPDLEIAFKDLADGVAQTDIGKRLASISPEFAALAEDAAAGRVGQQEFRDRMNAIAPGLNEFANSLGPAGIQATEGMSGLGALFSSLHLVNEFVSKTFSAEEAERAQARRDALTSLTTTFNQTIESVRTQILDKLISNGTIEAGITALNNAFSEEKIANFATNFSTFLDEFIADPKGKFTQVFEDVKDSFTTFFETTMTETVIPYATNVFETLKNKFMDFMFGNQDELGNRYGGFIETTLKPLVSDLMTTLKDLFYQEMPKVFEQIIQLGQGYINRFTGEGAAAPLAGKDTLTQEEASTVLRDITGQGLLNSSEYGGILAGLESVDDFGGQDLVNRLFASSGLGKMSMTNPFSSNRNVGDMQRALDELYRLSGTEQGLTPEQVALVQEFNRAIQGDIENSFSRGSGGFRDFGQGTLAMLHGEEAVVPRNSVEGQALTNGMNGATMNQEGVISAINQLNITMSQAAMMLANIEKNSKKQIGALSNVSSAVY